VRDSTTPQTLAALYIVNRAPFSPLFFVSILSTDRYLGMRCSEPCEAIAGPPPSTNSSLRPTAAKRSSFLLCLPFLEPFFSSSGPPPFFSSRARSLFLSFSPAPQKVLHEVPPGARAGQTIVVFVERSWTRPAPFPSALPSRKAAVGAAAGGDIELEPLSRGLDAQRTATEAKAKKQKKSARFDDGGDGRDGRRSSSGGGGGGGGLESSSGASRAVGCAAKVGDGLCLALLLGCAGWLLSAAWTSAAGLGGLAGKRGGDREEEDQEENGGDERGDGCGGALVAVAVASAGAAAVLTFAFLKARDCSLLGRQPGGR